MRSRLAFAVVASASVLAVWGGNAEACVCFDSDSVIFPQDGAVDVPTNARIVGIAAVNASPSLNVYYDADPTQVITGSLSYSASWGSFRTWVFVPDTALSAGSVVTFEWYPYPPPATGTMFSFSVGMGEDNTPPSFAGLESVDAAEQRVWSFTGEEDCIPWYPDPGTPIDYLRLGWTDAIDAATPAEALLYRVYLYVGGGAAPTSPFAVLPGLRADRETSCIPHDCRSMLDFALTPGENLCARVEAEDAAGNRVGYTVESCTTVASRDVDFVAGACEATSNGPSDAGGSGAPPGTGCGSCGVAVSPSLGLLQPLSVAGYILLVLRRRRRAE